MFIFGFIRKLIPWQIWVFPMVVACVIVAFVAERHHWISVGAQQEQTRIEDANHASERNADQASQQIDACVAGGGTWDRNGGVCNH